MMLVTIGREKWRLLSFVQEILQNCFLSYLIASISPGNLRSQTSRSPHISAMAWDKLSPVKTVGMATSVPSSQASPALVNALFERVEEQAEVRTFTLERLRFTFAPNDKNVNLYHMTKFSPYFPFTVYCFYTKISSFMPVLSLRIVLDCFYLVIFYSEKFSTDVCHMP